MGAALVLIRAEPVWPMVWTGPFCAPWAVPTDVERFWYRTRFRLPYALGAAWLCHWRDPCGQCPCCGSPLIRASSATRIKLSGDSVVRPPKPGGKCRPERPIQPRAIFYLAELDRKGPKRLRCLSRMCLWPCAVCPRCLWFCRGLWHHHADAMVARPGGSFDWRRSVSIPDIANDARFIRAYFAKQDVNSGGHKLTQNPCVKRAPRFDLDTQRVQHANIWQSLRTLNRSASRLNWGFCKDRR